MSRCGHLRRGSVGRMEGAEERPGEATEAVFSIPHIVKGFTVPEGGQLALAGYLESWTEFAARDVSAKVGILEKYLHGTNGEHYSTVQSMIIYERDNDLLTSSDRPSGARTLLRLHRALDYASEFVKELGNTSAENNFGRRVSEIYLSTLGRFNNKILAKTVSGLLLLLPPRKTMLQRMNEAAALTHSSLLRQASGVTVDASLQLLHRVLRARLDFSEQYRKQLNDAIDLLEYCTAVIHSPEQHDNIWQHFVISRAEMETLKDQLKDLNMLMTYAYTTLENAAMTAFMSGVEFTASAAQQAIDNARAKMEIDTKQNLALELQYVQRHTRYIEASQKVIDETEKASEDTEQIEDDLKENED
nr:uncharacterized protein LOC123758253 isoform X3 [Procambarus clarkii]